LHDALGNLTTRTQLQMSVALATANYTENDPEFYVMLHGLAASFAQSYNSIQSDFMIRFACDATQMSLLDGRCIDPTAGDDAFAPYACPGSTPVLCAGMLACVADESDCPLQPLCSASNPYWCAATSRCVSRRGLCTTLSIRAYMAPTTIEPSRTMTYGNECVAGTRVCPWSGICMDDTAEFPSNCRRLSRPLNVQYAPVDTTPCYRSTDILCASGHCKHSVFSPKVHGIFNVSFAASTLEVAETGLLPSFSVLSCPILAKCPASAPLRCVGGPCVGTANECHTAAVAGTAFPMAVDYSGTVSYSTNTETKPPELACPALIRPLRCKSNKFSGCFSAEHDGMLPCTNEDGIT
jgi:hypothetical protein